MASKLRIGNLAVALVVLTFLVSSFTLFFTDAESSLGVGGVGSDLESIDSNSNLSSETSDMSGELSSQVDDASDLAPEDDQQIEDRSSGVSGVLNLFSKNVVLDFFRELDEKFSFPLPVKVGFYSLLAVIVTILTVRFFWGETKV